MRFRRAGRWGLELSTVGFGTWPAGTATDADTDRLIRHAYDRGVRYVDTANFYQGGHREEVVGAALSGYPRESFVLATKVSFPIGDPPNNQGLSRKHVVEQCAASLRRLRTDHIDLYQCHRFEPDTPLEETCRAMDDLVRSGKIVYWGVTSWPAAGITAAVDLCRAHGWAPPISDQEQYSALWRTPEAEVLPAATTAGMAGLVWSPLAMGILGGRYRSVDELPPGSRATKPEGRWMAPFLTPEVLGAVAAARKLADDAGVTLPQLALSWCLSRPGITAVVVGASSTAQLDQTVQAADTDVDADLLAAFDAVLAPVAIREAA